MASEFIDGVMYIDESDRPTPEYWKELDTATMRYRRAAFTVSALSDALDFLESKGDYLTVLSTFKNGKMLNDDHMKLWWDATIVESELRNLLGTAKRVKNDATATLKKLQCDCVIEEQDKWLKYNNFLIKCMDAAMASEEQGLGNAGDIFLELTERKAREIEATLQ
jgi:hypothetical protein